MEEGDYGEKEKRDKGDEEEATYVLTVVATLSGITRLPQSPHLSSHLFFSSTVSISTFIIILFYLYPVILSTPLFQIYCLAPIKIVVSGIL